MSMTAKSKSDWTFAYRRDHVIRLAAGMKCCHCGRALSADDAERIGNEVGIICAGCHHELFAIENAPHHHPI
jgi:hypothetical protein